MWDFSVYGQLPDSTWVAIDRDAAGEVLRTLDAVDFWRPWSGAIEHRTF
jgi:hypothetical protein